MPEPKFFDEDTGAYVHGLAIPNLTMTAGAANDTLADVGTAFSQGTLNDNFRDLGEKVNAILAALRSRGIIAQD
ncbi:hypothetical protein ADL21_11140 [Streptomyces albus subsp. albus]|nr:hypothetical protein ADL21_11140 [Streptomyces albus subsp. albus]